MKINLKIGDIIIIALVLVVTIATYGVNIGRNFMSDDMVSVVVSVNGEIIDTHDLSKDIVKVYDTKYGHNVLEIHNGKAYISEADCRDQICILTKEAEMNGDAVICLPNLFSLEIVNGEGDHLDAVSQ
jgi:hypothetical protein